MPKNKKTNKKEVQKRVKRMRPRGIKSMKQNEFLETMGRLGLIDDEIKKEYLKNRFKEDKGE